MQTKANLQDLFLLRARRDKLPVTMFLMNGFQMRGTIAGFDAFVVVLDSDGASVSGYTMYYGLGYKVIQYQSEYSRSDCEIGTWFLQPGNIDSVTQAELDAIEAYLSEEMTLRYGDEKSFSSIKILLCEQTDAHTKKIYLWECTETFRASALRSGNTTAESGVSMPAAVTIRTADGQTTVTDVWRPRDGSFYAADIASEFPTCARRQLWEYDDGVQQRVRHLLGAVLADAAAGFQKFTHKNYLLFVIILMTALSSVLSE